jgi:hypothetical protein
MNEAKALELIESGIKPTRQKVIIAKGAILEIAETTHRTQDILDTFLARVEAKLPTEIVLHQSVDPLPDITMASDSISWIICSSEAIWELIHSNLLVQSSSDLASPSINISWTTVIPGSGGQSAGWNLSKYSLPIPVSVSKPPSRSLDATEYLSNADLYLMEIGITGIHQEVEESLLESVRCFRHELYTASLVMLGKASEGAWLDLGEALIDFVPEEDASKVERIRIRLEDPNLGIGKKINEIVTLFERQDIFGELSTRSGIRLQEIRIAASWSDTIRESRNTIHFGVSASTPNTYEKIAALLLGAVPRLRSIYGLISEARNG